MMDWLARLRLRAWPVAALLALLACAADPRSAEEQLRALVDSAQAAANEQDAPALQALIAQSYRDASGQSKADIDQIIRLQLLRGRPYVLARVQQLELEPEGSARLRVLAGMARVPVGGFEQLLQTSADVFVFDLELREASQEGWLVTSARWRRAQREDLLQ